MSQRLSGKVVIVTGGASGIGAATVEACLREGAAVVVADIQRETAENVATLAQDLGLLDQFAYCHCDVSQDSDMQNLFRYTLKRFGRLDCMINNAGSGGSFTSILDTAPDDWDRTQQNNLRSAFLGTKYAAEVMIQQGQGGSIINVSSVAAVIGGAAGGAYSASKGGVLSFSKVAAVQFGKHHIRVNTVIPGAIVSPLTHRNIDPEGLKEHARQMQPMPIAGEPHLIAPALVFLASDESRFVSGTELVVDGGSLAQGDYIYSGKHPFGNGVLERARQAGVFTFDHGAYQAPKEQAQASIIDRLNHEQLERTTQRLVLVTGVSKGLGRELCRGLIAAGHRVIGCARRQDVIEKYRAEFGPQHDFQTIDVSDEMQVKEWAADITSRLGTPDLILNNAAIVSEGKQVWRSTDAELEQVLNVNVRGTANICRHFSPAMIRAKTGVIVNFSSGWGREAAAKVSAYCASKWAIEGFTKAMSLEVPNFMAVVSLHPGIIQTDTMAGSFGESAKLCPTPEEWAKVAVPYILGITAKDNGRQLSVPGMTHFRGMGPIIEFTPTESQGKTLAGQT
jgi:NAD(P)-dependent dehydrogenase (short-subunit alcohol dehydrogenase family)